VVAPFADRIQINLIRKDPGGPARGRNTGVQAARGRYVAFLDDDCIPEPGWLGAMELALRASPGAMIGGKTRNGLPANPYSAASQFTLEMVYAFNNQDPRAARFFATNNMALPRDRFSELGGFDEDYVLTAGEDRDLCDRWRQAGFPMIHHEAAVIRHCHALSLVSYCRQHFTYGRGAVRFHSKAAARGSSRLRDHIGFHGRLPTWFMRALRSQPPASPFKLIVLFLTGQALNAAGFFYERLHSLRGRRSRIVNMLY
jgi:GT2 family glycosyltransferase